MDDEELARRIRAARAYKGLSREQVGKKIGVSGVTVRRMEDQSLTRDIKDVELAGIADACDLPADFFNADLQLLRYVAEAWPDESTMSSLREFFGVDTTEGIVKFAFDAIDAAIERDALEQTGQVRLGTMPDGLPLIAQTDPDDPDRERILSLMAEKLQALKAEIRQELEERFSRLEEPRDPAAEFEEELQLEAGDRRLEQPGDSTEPAADDRDDRREAQ